MKCDKARQLINAFIEDKMDYAVTPEFLEHVKNCPECYEDLELNYLIYSALNELDGSTENYSLTDAMNKALKDAELRHTARTSGRVALYVIITCAIWFGVAVVMHFLRNGMLTF